MLKFAFIKHCNFFIIKKIEKLFKNNMLVFALISSSFLLRITWNKMYSPFS